MTSPLLKTVRKKERRPLYTFEEVENDALGGLAILAGALMAIIYMILAGGI